MCRLVEVYVILYLSVLEIVHTWFAVFSIYHDIWPGNSSVPLDGIVLLVGITSYSVLLDTDESADGASATSFLGFNFRADPVHVDVLADTDFEIAQNEILENRTFIHGM